MDDQLLEKRLENLKKAYNEMPEDENRSAILATIKKDQKKQKQNKWFHLPYAASFIGVGMIAGVLMMQYIGDHVPSGEKSEQHQVSGDNAAVELDEDDVKAEFEELRKYYSVRQKETKEKLGLGAGYENWLFHSMDELKATEAEILQNLENTDRTEFKEVVRELRGTIDEGFTLPAELIADISKEEANKEVGRKEELLSLQLESYLGAYIQSMVLYEWDLDQVMKKEKASEVVKKLNGGGKGLPSESLKKLATGAVDNGYAFREEDGKILPYIDFLRVAERLKPHGNEDFIKYLVLRSNTIQDRNGVVMSYEQLGELLVKLEKESEGVKDSMIHQTIVNDAESLFSLFVIGSSLNPLFDENNLLKEEVKKAYHFVIKQYPATDTAEALKTHYEKLEKSGFEKPTALRVELFPEYLQIPAQQGYEEERFTQSIHLLPDDLLSAYKGFKAKKDFNILKDYGPFEIMQLYFYADSLKDYETKYALYSQNDGKPTKEQYIKEQKIANMDLGDALLKGYEYATLYHAEDDPEKVVGVQLHYAERPDGPVFQMVQEGGVWKVQFLPFQ
ncbi:hypothetical protein LC048_01870 [Mesobacillus subterraneus]|uniref:hypothetical protein n=1 Tax=Mesobacillus subterraneus TaxID=285983 RepID=UPI001CFCB9E4|nr:hypothetical protein [Mesobacillus subterraneus]WLR55781.1 hypothetical protein LC048_01870 [Mesobacillus subterraneus]